MLRVIAICDFGVLVDAGVVARELSELESNRFFIGVVHSSGLVRGLRMLAVHVGFSACIFHIVAVLVVAVVGMVGRVRIGGYPVAVLGLGGVEP